MNHIVRRVVLEVNTSSTPQESAVQQTQVATLCKAYLPALLDRFFSEWSNSDELFEIDSLEVAIDEVNLNQIETEWAAKIEPLLREALENSLSRYKSESGKTPSQSATSLLCFFLEHGYLPWWADAFSEESITKALRSIAASPDQFKKDQRQAVIRALASTNAQYRLARYGKDGELLTFSGILASPALHNAVSAFFEAFKSSTPAWSAARQRFWQAVWQSVVAEQTDFGAAPETLSQLLWQSIPEAVGILKLSKIGLGKDEVQKGLDLFYPAVDKNVHTEHAISNESGTNLIQENQLLSKTEEHTDNNIETTPEIESQEDMQSNETTASSSAPALPNQSLPSAVVSPLRTFDESENLYIFNAGLVLLAPYFPSLFERLGWVEERTFVGQEAHFLAIQLCQFLCNGQSDPPEYQLLLPKILCGLRPEALYEPERILNETECAEAETLLKTVLEHAPGLGLKSIEGLRGSFLLRKGVLRSAGNHWLLHVEKETYDVVLNQIPWNFQIIKFPWMEVPIMVDWDS